ncbi:MAG TPA: lactate 2-monooxygenase [Longimicrobiaceae bacterium]|nr:lactate 2-monooxygenase [Longimicrobiaceae bacterium]
MSERQPAPDRGRARQAGIFVAGVGGRRPAVPTHPARLEEEARRAMSPEGFAYMAGGAGTESTVRANREAFERWRIVPRMLRDVSVRDTSVELFGARLPVPLLLAPIGVLEMAHPQADLAVARAAAAEGVPMIFSNQASHPMEACARAMGDAPRWFQLYWSRSDDLVASFVRRAEACGCSAIVLTLDTTMLGWRPRDLDLGYLPFLRGMGIAQYTSDPVFRASLAEPLDAPPAEKPAVNPASLAAFAGMVRRYPGAGLRERLRTGAPRAAVQRFIATYSRPSLTWDDLGFLRDRTRLPILLKGILHPEDARMALERGMDGVVVSNHGGRQVDGAVAALDALPGVVEAVGGRVPVLFDSGVRTGADVFRALALGATAVCLGRPYAYGLALAGADGVREVIRNVAADFDLTLGLAGCASAAGIGRESLARTGDGAS